MFIPPGVLKRLGFGAMVSRPFPTPKLFEHHNAFEVLSISSDVGVTDLIAVSNYNIDVYIYIYIYILFCFAYTLSSCFAWTYEVYIVCNSWM